MNEAKILNMNEGTEIDALVAEKVMGWHKSTKFFWTWVDEKERPTFRADFALEGEPWWNPSDDMSIAWEVMEKIKRGVESFWWEPTSGKWVVMIGGRDGMIRVKANTAPLAICRAALLLKEVRDV